MWYAGNFLRGIKNLFVSTIRLAQQPFHPVAVYRSPDISGNCKTDSVPWKPHTSFRCSGTEETPEEGSLDSFTMLKYKRKVFLSSQNFWFSESMPQQSKLLSCRRLSFIAHGQFPTAFRAAPGQNFSSIFCFHPVTKTMFIFSLYIARLKCALHAKTLRYWMVLYRKKGLSFTILFVCLKKFE